MRIVNLLVRSMFYCAFELESSRMALLVAFVGSAIHIGKLGHMLGAFPPDFGTELSSQYPTSVSLLHFSSVFWKRKCSVGNGAYLVLELTAAVQ